MLSKPPIYNPYDKFTQPEFNAWIGGITGALRKALGQVDDEIPPKAPNGFNFNAIDDNLLGYENDLPPEDSFAEIKARRSKGKGKARDPREGPGLPGFGNKDQPIEILSDEEEQSVNREEEEEDDEEENGEVWDQNVNSGDEYEEDTRYSFDRRHSSLELQRTSENSDEGDYDEGVALEPSLQYHRQHSQEQIVHIFSDEEDEKEIRYNRQRSTSMGSDEEQYVHEDEEAEEGEEDPLDTSQLLARGRPPHMSLELPESYYQQEESEIMDDDELQPLNDDTSFPPHSTQLKPPNAIDIPDPWSGPQTYAEDYYAGGDLKEPVNAHMLGPTDYDNFLTPDVMTPIDQSESGEQSNSDEEEEDFVSTKHQKRRMEAEIIDIVSGSEEEKDLETGIDRDELGEEYQRYDGDADGCKDELYGSSPVHSSPLRPQYVNLPSQSKELEYKRQGHELDALHEDTRNFEYGPEPEQVDWNYPPAFPSGVPASAPGHLATPSDDESGPIADDEFSPLESRTPHQPINPLKEELDEDEDEDEDEVYPGAYPLGTSDFEVPEEAEEESYEEFKKLVQGTIVEEVADMNADDEENTQEKQMANERDQIDILEGDDNANILGDMDEPKAQEVTRAINENDSSPFAKEIVQESAEHHASGTEAFTETEFPTKVIGDIAEDEHHDDAQVDRLIDESQFDHLAEEKQLDEVSQPDDLDAQPQPSAGPSVSLSYQHYDFEQLPTPPSERLSTEPDEEELTYPFENEELPKEDATPLMGNVEVDQEAELNFEIEEDQLQTQTYTIFEKMSEEEGITDEDADGEDDDGVEILSISSGDWDGNGDDNEYSVEEPLTEGRLTEEPPIRGISLDVVSVDTSPELLTGNADFEPEKDTESTNRTQANPHLETAAGEYKQSSKSANEGLATCKGHIDAKTAVETDIKKEVNLTSSQQGDIELSARVSHLPDHAGVNIPLPVSADASVLDPTETAIQHQPLILSLPGTPSFTPIGTPGTGVPVPVSVAVTQAFLQALRDGSQSRGHPDASSNGLFTPRNASGSATPEILADTVEEAELVEGKRQGDSVNKAKLDNSPREETTESSLLDDARPSSVEGNFDAFGTVKYAGDASDSTVSQTQSSLLPSSLPNRGPSVGYTSKVVMTLKPTDPVLYSDPYPYSLSTPGSGFIDHFESDDGTEHDNSMSSSSTTDKGMELEENEKPKDFIDTRDIEDHKVHHAEGRPDISTTDSHLDEGPETRDTDSDGDLDPEFIHELISTTNESSPPPVADIMKEEDPFKLMGTDSRVAPGPVEDEEPRDVLAEHLEVSTASSVSAKSPEMPSSINVTLSDAKKSSQEDEIIGVEISTLSKDAAPAEDALEITNKVEEVSLSTNPNNLSETDVLVKKSREDGHKMTGQRSSSHISKRKRSASPSHADLSGRLSPKSLVKTKTKVDQSKSKPPDRDLIQVRPGSRLMEKDKGDSKKWETSREGSEIPSEHSNGSGSSIEVNVAAKMLQSSSPGPSDDSFISQSSPAVNKPYPVPQLTLFHAHGRARKVPQLQNPTIPSHPVPSPLSPQQHDQPRVQRTPSTSRQTVEHSSTLPPSLPSHRPAPSTSSPVTRSHCRYRKISVPKEEGGIRVYFIVPGCSLTDKELIAEEEIQDHGEATREDSLHIVSDIDSLDFDSYLIGTLRQLVGVDLLREQEVYYLPTPGVEIPRKTGLRRTASEKSAMAGVDSTSITRSPSLSLASMRSPASSKAPPSTTGSATTSRSLLRKVLGSEKDTASTFSDTESQSSYDDEQPKFKRSRPSPSPEKSEGRIMGPPTSQRHPLKAQRRKRLGSDAAAYNPDEHESSDSKGRKKKTGKRGLKRGRTSTSEQMDADYPESRKQKKQKSHGSIVSAPGTGAASETA